MWFLFNESYDNVDGIVHGSADTGSRTGAYYIGNLLHDNLNSGMQLNDWVDEEYVIGNTFYRNPIGLENGYYRISLEISDNIFSQSSTAHISFGGGRYSGAVSNLRNSLFDAPVRIVWDDVTYTVAGIQAIGQGQGCLSGDPLFVNAAGGDFNLQFGSPAIDNGAAEAVYTTFRTLYGIDIRKDKAGRDRPQGASWDIGAYELTDVLPDVSVDDAAGMEGDEGSRRLDFTVTLSQASRRAVRVDYTTVDAGAMESSDYRQLSGSLLFPPGSTTQTVGVEVLGDDVYEPDEPLILRLTNVVGGTLLRSEGVGTIVNDDAPGLMVSDGYAVERPGALVRFVVTLAPPQAAPVAVSFATSDGTAEAGVDYAYSSGLLTFPPNVTEQVIDVPVYADSLVERVETFTVALSGASGGPIVWAQATGRIFDPGVGFVSPVGGGDMAAFDVALGVPVCAGGSSCDSGSLLVGRGPVGPDGGTEPHYPNTLAPVCADGPVGFFHYGPSLDRLRIATLDGSPLAPGKGVQVEATVWVYSPYNALDLYYAADASNPQWTYLQTLMPPTGASMSSPPLSPSLRVASARPSGGRSGTGAARIRRPAPAATSTTTTTSCSASNRTSPTTRAFKPRVVSGSVRPATRAASWSAAARSAPSRTGPTRLLARARTPTGARSTPISRATGSAS